MRTAILPLILAVAAAPLTARQAAAIQQNPKAEKPAVDSAAKPAAPTVAVEAADSGKAQLSKATLDSLNQLVARFRRDPEAVALLWAKCRSAPGQLSNADNMALVGVLSTQLLQQEVCR